MKTKWAIKVSYGLLGLFVLALFLGCNSRPAIPSGKIRLTFWTISLSPSYDAYIEGLIRRYETENPHLQIEWVDLPQSAARQKFLAGIAAGDPPDLVNMDTEFTLFLAENGALADLSSLVSSAQKDRYFPNLWEASSVDGAVYAIPWYVTTRVVMYNKAVLAKAGLDPEKPPVTWEDFDRYARQVSKNTDAVGMMPSVRIINDWSMAGSPIVDRKTLKPEFTAPESVAVLERYAELYSEGVMPPETLTEGYRGALDRYKAGSLAFLEAGPQFLLRIKADAPSVYKNTGLTALPMTQTKTLPAATMNFTVPRSARNRKESVKLALFLTSPEAQLEFCKLVPILPSTVETARDPYFLEGAEDPLMAAAVRISLEQLPRARDFSLALPRNKDLTRALNDAVEQAIRGEQTSQKALEKAAQSWDETLAPFRKD